MASRRKAKKFNNRYDGGFSVQMKHIEEDIVEEVKTAMYEAMDGVAEEAANKLKATSPRLTGDYANGWDWYQLPYGARVYNATDWQLTHLLEFGHAVRPRPTHKGKKNRVEARPHIAPVEQWAIQELDNRIERLLR